MTKSQIEKLGGRLVAGPHIGAEDRQALNELLIAYGETLRHASQRVRDELGLSPTARVKNTGTIIEKLERYGGSWLKSIQDIAGMRIVGDFDRAGQDSVVARLVELFMDEARAPKVIDRRAEPVQGYRAVHVVLHPNGVPVEVQVRTRRQHGWAELFEKLADSIGRGIRYGEPPDHWLTEGQRAELDATETAFYESNLKFSLRTVEAIKAAGRHIAEFESMERTAPNAAEVAERRDDADALMAELRALIDEMVSLNAEVRRDLPRRA